MLVAVDETGYFRNAVGSDFGIVTLVTTTDQAWIKCKDFLTRVLRGNIHNTKGTNISYSDRIQIIKYIGKHPEIKYTCMVYDLSRDIDSSIQAHKDASLANMIHALKRTTGLKQTFINDIQLLHNQIRKFKTADYAKFVIVTNLFIEWQRYFQYDYLTTSQKNDGWFLRHIIDTQVKPDKFKRLVRAMIWLNTNHMNPNYKIFTPQEWNLDHPLLKNYRVTADSHLQNASKFYENFEIRSEQEEPLLLLPDLIGNTIYRSIQRRNEIGWLRILKRLRQSRSLVLTHGGKTNRYYLISGFDNEKPRHEVNPALKEHHQAMLNA